MTKPTTDIPILDDDAVAEAEKLFANEPPWTVEAHDARGDYVKIALVRRAPTFTCGYYVIAADDMAMRREQAITDFKRIKQVRDLLPALCETVRAERERADSNYAAYDRVKGLYSETINQLKQVTRERDVLKLSDEEIKVLTDYHYYEAEKAITRRGDRAGRRHHLERLEVIREQLK